MRHVIDNKAGRKPLPAYKKKDEKLTIKLTSAQRAIVHQRAKEANVSESEYARQAIFEGVILQRVSPELMKSIHDLNNLGNDLHDLRNRALASGMRRLSGELGRAVQGIGEVLREARHQMKHERSNPQYEEEND